jgi:hypothetical protein
MSALWTLLVTPTLQKLRGFCIDTEFGDVAYSVRMSDLPTLWTYVSCAGWARKGFRGWCSDARINALSFLFGCMFREKSFWNECRARWYWTVERVWREPLFIFRFELCQLLPRQQWFCVVNLYRSATPRRHACDIFAAFGEHAFDA